MYFKTTEEWQAHLDFVNRISNLKSAHAIRNI